MVTRRSVLIHKNARIGIEITSQGRRYYGVERDGQRLRLRAGSGGSTETSSFQPPDDAEGWARDIRAVIRGSESAANR